MRVHPVSAGFLGAVKITRGFDHPPGVSILVQPADRESGVERGAAAGWSRANSPSTLTR
jgi:hypothetical protein